MQNIRNEARRNSKLTLDIDNLRQRYREVDNENNIEVSFPGFELYAFEKNFFTLLSKSKKVSFKPLWYQRPDYVSFEYYGTVIFWQLILFVNRIDMMEDFINLTEILIPPYDLILKLSKDKLPASKVVRIKEETDLKSKSKYYKIQPLDDKELATLEGEDTIDDIQQPDEEEIIYIILDGGGEI